MDRPTSGAVKVGMTVLRPTATCRVVSRVDRRRDPEIPD